MTVTLGKSSSDSHAIGRATLADGAFCAVNRGATRMATASDKSAAYLTMSQAFYRSPDSGAKSPRGERTRGLSEAPVYTRHRWAEESSWRSASSS